MGKYLQQLRIWSHLRPKGVKGITNLEEISSFTNAESDKPSRLQGSGASQSPSVPQAWPGAVGGPAFGKMLVVKRVGKRDGQP